MATKSNFSAKPSVTPSSAEAPDLTPDLQSLADKAAMAKLAAWVKGEVDRAKTARTTRQLQWKTNMYMFAGQQWTQVIPGVKGLSAPQFRTPAQAKSVSRKTINRIRAIARSEMSRYLSQVPNAVAVPSTAEDQDQRAALAAEQVWLSVSSAQHLPSYFARMIWWYVITGTGFIKTEWDNNSIDKVSGQPGVIKYSAPSPFHLFVPDLREADIEDQPYVIQALVKPVEWIKRNYGALLGDRDLVASVSSGNQVIEASALGLTSEQKPDSCVLYETWIKPGGHDDFPEGGLIQQVDDIILNVVKGFPYKHGLYPYAKFENIPTNTFYGESVLVDLNELQKEFNTLRSEISDAGKKMGRPQLLATIGSIVPGKVTNEAGLIIGVKAGYPMPQPLTPAPLPQYYVDQQQVVLQDMEDLSGQHEVSRGEAPAGITAGTAINYLQEKDNQFFAPQYQSIEAGYEKLAISTVELFMQYVPYPRKVKTIGADGAFDTQMLSSSDVAGGTDIRIEPGSAVGESQAAKEAKVMDMFGMGLIDQNMALRLMEVGGAQKILDILSAAEKKAQRENMKMKMLKPEEILQAEQEYEEATMQAGLDPSMFAGVGSEVDNPVGAPPADPTGQAGPPPAPPLVQVADFDVHEIHIDVHNKFRMSQEYEILPPEVQEQFEKHVKDHENKMIQKQMMSFLQMIPSDGSDGSPEGMPQSMDVETPGGPPPEEMPAEGEPATMPPGGATPAPAMPTGV